MPVKGSVGVFEIHPGHPFDGLAIVGQEGSDAIVARCGCGDVLAIAPALFSVCPECCGVGHGCLRCGSTGRVVDHAGLQWRKPDETEDIDG
jgi:hypothetical protein